MRRFVGHAVQRCKSAEAQPVQIGQRADDIGIDQLVHQFLAQALDLHRAALGKMQNRLLALGAAKQPTRAAVIGLALLPHGRAAAHRAHARHGEHLTALGQSGLGRGQHHAHHFRDDIPRAAHDHGVTHPHVLAPGFILVVQGGVGDGDPAHKHRGQLGYGGEFAGAPYLHINAQNDRELLLRRKFVRYRPARLPGHKTHAALQGQAVDLVDHTVNVIR